MASRNQIPPSKAFVGVLALTVVWLEQSPWGITVSGLGFLWETEVLTAGGVLKQHDLSIYRIVGEVANLLAAYAIFVKMGVA